MSLRSAALWCAYGASLCGRWVHGFALSWFIFDHTRSATTLALVAALVSLPGLALAPVAAQICRRIGPRRTLVTTQSAASLLAALTAMLAHASALDEPTVLGIATGFGIIAAVDTPVLQAWLIDATGERGLAATIARQSLAFNATRMAAPMLATAMAAGLGVASCFAVNAACCLPLLAMIARSDVSAGDSRLRDTAPPSDNPWMGSLLPVLRPLALLACFSLLGSPLVGLLPAISAAVLGPGVVSYGMLASAVGVGAFAASLGLTCAESLLGHGRLGPASMAVFALSGIALGTALPQWTHCLAAALLGASLSVFLTQCNHRLHAHSTRANRERITSLYTALLVGLPAAGTLLLGTISDAFGVAAVVTVDCTLLAAVALAAMARGSCSARPAPGRATAGQSSQS